MRPAESRGRQRHAGDAAGVAMSGGDRWLGVNNLGVDRQMRVQAGSTELPVGMPDNARDYQADHRPGHLHEISELCLSNLLQFRFSGAGLLQPELPGDISATRDCRDSRADLCRYAGGSALRSFYFFQRIERLELEARRLAALAGDGPAASAARKQIVNDVATLRHGGEMKSYIDLLFLTLIVVLCISKIVTN
jgi:hypothetical protein